MNSYQHWPAEQQLKRLPQWSAYRSPSPFSPHLWTWPLDTSFTQGRTLSLTRREHSVLFPARDHGLGFGGVDSPSHLPAGCSNENCASPSDEANRTTSSAKSRDEISPKWVPSTLCPSLGYEHNWWQRATWWSPAVTGNMSELLPAMLTKLWTLAICCLV